MQNQLQGEPATPASGNSALDDAQLAALLARLQLSFEPRAARGSQPGVAEIRISLSNTREFGLVLSAGLGGADAMLDPGHFKKDRAAVHAITELTDAATFLQQFRSTLAYRKSGSDADAALQAAFAGLLKWTAETGTQTLAGLQLDAEVRGAQLVVTGAQGGYGAPRASRLPRPIHKIDKLIHPSSIGLIGVSATGMNFGRIILRNLMGSGYPKEKLTIIRAGESEIDGVKCVESLKALSAKLDLLIVAVAADAVYPLADEIIESGMVESVMLIPGGLGETKKSKEPAAALAARINAAHGRADGSPIFLGANCLGVVSHPGAYDSWFIPLERLPKPQKKPQRNSVLLSQSGAFMISRLSHNPWLDPAYMLALGNQTDLTQGDLLTYFAKQPGIETIGIYVEGFKDLDGRDFAKAARAAVASGKQVVVYKSGKTAPGMGGVMGHTASIAGDPVLFDSVMRQAGAIVADEVNDFDDLFYIAGALHGKKIGGNRLGAISGAGYEAVGMADSIETATFAMTMGELTDATVKRVEEILAAKRLDALVEVRNPIDINPGADDEAHLQISEAFLSDPNIDAVIVGLDPTAPSVRSLEQSKLRPGYDISDPNSAVHMMPPLAARTEKPLIGVIDAGRLYDAMSAALMDQGVCVFRNCARGTRALVRYVEARLVADSIRQRQAKS